MKIERRPIAAAISIIALILSGCDEIDGQRFADGNPSCAAEREVSGWAVSSGLQVDKASNLLVSRWEVRRNFDSHFGLRIAFDTSRSPEPYLVIWHDYKTGEFNMRMPDGAQLRTRLNANYAVTQSSLRPVDVDALRSAPVRIEHTTHEGKWRVYQTDGLPEALAAAGEDLEIAKTKLNNKECAA